MTATPCHWKVRLLIAAAIAFLAPTTRVDAFSVAHKYSWLENRMTVVLFEDSSEHNYLRGDGLVNEDKDADFTFTAATIETDKEQRKMSELDIIRMLRTYPHQSKTPSIEKASDVLQLLSSQLHSPSLLFIDSSTPICPEVIVKLISPNIAAAALKRLVSPPFIPLSFSTTKKLSQYLGKNKWSNPSNDEVQEKEKLIYIQLIHHLLMKLSTVVDEKLQAVIELSSNKSQIPQLLPRNETWHHPEDITLLNWYGWADFLSAISTLSNIPQSRASVTNYSRNNEYHMAISQVKEDNSGVIKSLFRKTIQYLAWDNKVTSSFIRCIGSRRLIRDLLQSLVIADTQRRMSEVARWEEMNFEDNYDDDDESSSLNENLHKLMSVSAAYLESPSSLAKVTAADISHALWSFAQIYQPPQSSKLQSYRSFIKACTKRLRKRTVISPARGSELALAIWSVERLLGLLDREGDDESSRLQPFQDILSLPIQLPGEEITIDSSYNNAPLLSQSTTCSAALLSIDSLNDDAVIMFHTIINELLYQGEGNKKMKLRSLSLQQIADILQTALAFNVSCDYFQDATNEILVYLASDPFVVSQTHSCRDISRTLCSLQRLRVGSGMFDLGMEECCVRRLGDRFLEIVSQQSKGRQRHKCDPKTLTKIVRSGVMMFSDSNVTKSLLDAAAMLILDDTIPFDVSGSKDVIFVDSGATSSFLLQCNDFELSCCLWAFAVARCYNTDVFVALTDQILESISESSFTASSASRVMWSTSVLLSLDGVGDQHDGRRIDLFHQLSPMLLSSQLSPTDVSCAMYSMAKTNYVLDRGIFDFLAKVLSSDEMLERSKTRLISQAVWACGKMAEFEDPIISSKESHGGIREDAVLNQPPYLNDVYKMLTVLIKKKEQMTPKHVAETIWAVGRLKISDRYLLEEMGGIASNIALSCNARQIANIVWGFSKVDYADDPQLISTLVRVVTSSDLSQQCTSQEASNMIYALGRLNIREEDLFAGLSLILKSQIHNANSQAIANALWGHEVVGFEPPSELLSVWARDTLRIDCVSL